ncbi:MAG: hypothetical protein B7Y39_15125 [Bdellovibrio sp. 28-41-41]|nr:MAG: hypothetical protein B7Y39_15125 [Bdellovibrio sp. 28-41-41]
MQLTTVKIVLWLQFLQTKSIYTDKKAMKNPHTFTSLDLVFVLLIVLILQIQTGCGFMHAEFTSYKPSEASSFVLLYPAGTISNNQNPQFLLSGLDPGSIVHLYSDSNCNSELANATTTDSGVAQLTTSTLSEGVYSIFYRVFSSKNNTSTECIQWSQGPYTVDLQSPTLVQVSSSNPDAQYKFGNLINIEIEFSEPVLVSGTPKLSIQLSNQVRVIDYTGGSGTNKISFSYIVGLWESAADLDYTSSSALDLNSGSISDLAGNVSPITLDTPGGVASLAGNKNLKILSHAQSKLVDSMIISGSRLSSTGAYYGGAVAYSEDKLTLAVGAPFDDMDGAGLNPVTDSGAVFIYVRTSISNPWVLQQKIVANGTNARLSNDNFGSSVSMSGDTLAVAAVEQDYDENGASYVAGAGAVFVFTRTGSVWSQQQKIVASGTSSRIFDDSFGSSVSIFGDTIAVSAPGQDYDGNGVNLVSDAGAVFVYTRSSSVWSHQQKIVASGVNARMVADNFGSSVSLYSDTLAIGAYYHDYDENGANNLFNPGAVFVFMRSGSVWNLQQKIVASGTNARLGNDYFGGKVSLYLNTLAVAAAEQGYDENGASYVAGAGAVFVFTRSGEVWTHQQKIVASGTNARISVDKFGSSLSISGDTLVVGAPDQDYDENGANPISNTGAVYVFTRSGSVWTQQQKLVATGANSRIVGDGFGYSLSVVGDSLAIGSYRNDYDENGADFVSDAGAVFEFARNASAWSQQNRLVDNSILNSQRILSDSAKFGSAVALSEDKLTLAIGVPYDDTDEKGANFVSGAGAVFIYTRSTTSVPWVLQQKILATGTNARVGNDNFGSNLSLSQNTLAVATINQSYDENGANPIGNAGAVYVFTRTGTTWTQQQKLVATGTNARLANDHFGSSLSLSEDTLAVGASEQDYDENGGVLVTDAGAVFIFTRTGTTWTQQQKIVASGLNARVASDGFGYKLSLSGETLAVGAGYQDYDENGANMLMSSGAAYVFTRSSSVWTQQQKIVSSGANARLVNDHFGNSISLYENTLVVGAPDQDYDENGGNMQSGAGTVFVFTRTGTTWTQQQKIVASGTNARLANDHFGSSISLYGNTLVAGAPAQDYDENGGFLATDAGAIFVFTRTGTTWTQQQKIVASGTNTRLANDHFGSSIFLSTDTFAIGVPDQDYDENGINFVSAAGAVYLFDPHLSP